MYYFAGNMLLTDLLGEVERSVGVVLIDSRCIREFDEALTVEDLAQLL